MQLGYAKAREKKDEPKSPERKLPYWNGSTNCLQGDPDAMLDFCMWLQREDIFNMLVSLANRGELK